jgi:hypothetical protein
MATTATLTATVQDSGGSVIPGASTYWTSEDPSIATVNQSGVVTAVAVGSTVIHAISGQASATKTVTVISSDIPPNPTLGEIDPTSAVQGATVVSLTVLGLDIPDDATLEFSNAGITVGDATPADDGSGLTGHINVADDAVVGSGTVRIHSDTTGDSGTLAFAVTAMAQVLDHLTLLISDDEVLETDTAPSLAFGAWATSDESTIFTGAVDPAAVYSSSDPGVAIIDPDTGEVTLVGTGETTLTVDAGGKSASVTLTVTSANRLWADVSGVISAIDGTHQLLIKYGTSFEDGTDVTSSAAFESDDTAVATVDRPTVTSISPPSIVAGGSGSYTITGTNARTAGQDIEGLPDGVVATDFARASDTVWTVTLTADSEADTGLAAIYIADPDHGDSDTAALTVYAAGVNLVGTPVRAALDTSSTAALAVPSFAAVAGNLIVVTLRGNSGGGSPSPTITDTAGNTYTRIGSNNKTSGNYFVAMYYAKNCTGNAANVVTWTDTNSSHKAIAVSQYSGASTTAPLDQHVQNVANGGGSVTSPSYTTTVATERIVIAAHADASNLATPSGFTAAFTAGTLPGLFGESVSAIQTAATTTVTSVGGTDNLMMLLATFK